MPHLRSFYKRKKTDVYLFPVFFESPLIQLPVKFCRDVDTVRFKQGAAKLKPVVRVVAFLYFLKVIELSWVLFQEMKKTDTRLTDEELTERHKVLRYTARVMKWIILVSIFSPWVGMSSSLMLNALYGIIIFPLLLGFIVLFLVYGYNMAECIEVDDEIASAMTTYPPKERRVRR